MKDRRGFPDWGWFLRTYVAPTLMFCFLLGLGGVALVPGPDARPSLPTSVLPDRCPEDAVLFSGSCIPADDFPEGSLVRDAAEGMLGFCPVGTAVIEQVSAHEWNGSCSPVSWTPLP